MSPGAGAMNGCEDESEKSRDLDKDAMDTDDADFEYIVERIVDRRRNKDFIEYKVKWKGTDESKNTWEAADDLDCEELINSFESELRAERNEKRRKRLNGELEPNILGCTRKGDSLWYLIQW